jgi:hypothetical protein
MSELTDRLAAIQAQLDAAAPGPWESADDPLSEGDWMVRQTDFEPDTPDDVAAVISHESTAEFIAAGPENIRYLLDLARKQQAALDAVKDFIGWCDAAASREEEFYSKGKISAIATAERLREALEAKA